MSKIDLKVTASDIMHWFDLIHGESQYMMKYTKGEGSSRVFNLYERTEFGFCLKGQCVGVNPEDAFIKMAKEKDPLFTVNVKAVF